MSQPRRRRRRGGRKKPSTSDALSPQKQGESQREKAPGTADSGPKSRRRRGRGRRGTGSDRAASPKLSEDLVRALPSPRPETLMLPPDGQKLEILIGELQSTWGVPQYPQEFRITIRVAEPRDRDRGERPQVAPLGETKQPLAPRAVDPSAPRREKAPPPERLSDAEAPSGEGGQRKRRSRRRRRGGRGPGAGPAGPQQGGVTPSDG